jgi:uncharacterized protein (TIGR02118 family)
MVRMMVVYGKPNDLDSFERHYRDVHIPVARKLPHLHAYSVSEDVRGPEGEARTERVETFDFSDRRMLDEALASDDGRAMMADTTSLAKDGMMILTFEVKDGR